MVRKKKEKVLPPRPDSAWLPTPVSALPRWADARRVAIDVETRDDQLTVLGPGVRRGGYVVGVSFAIEDGPAHYVPFRHEGGDNVDAEQAVAYLRDNAASFTGTIVGANLGYDLDYLAEIGIVFPRVKWFRDVQIAEPLIDDLQFTYALEAIAGRRDLPGKDETLLNAAAASYGFDPKADLWRLPARFVGAYAEQDVRLPLTILRRQEREIEEQGLWPIFDLESRVLPVLVRMRRRGVAVDFDRLDRVEQFTLAEEQKALQMITRASGVLIGPEDLTKAVALAKALDAVGISYPMTPKTQKPSIKMPLLSVIDHDVARGIVRARRMRKVRNDFVGAVREHAINGRIHATFNQLRATKNDQDDEERGARYGRCSSSDPNLQNQPARDAELGPMWRSIYRPDEGALWACCDYSQQEPRWTVHYAERLGLVGAFEAAECYRNDPNVDNHDMMARLIAGKPADWKPDKHTRDIAKIIFLGLCYGMGGGKLCRSLGLPTEWRPHRRSGKMVEFAGPEGQAILDNFNARVPFVKQLAWKASDRAKEIGYVVTAGGRRCRFPQTDQGYDWTHKALNRVIQGSSADQMKTAMVMADAEGFELQLQVHDELDLSVADPAEANELAEVMKVAIPAKVPFKVDVEVGPSWGELEKAA